MNICYKNITDPFKPMKYNENDDNDINNNKNSM